MLLHRERQRARASVDEDGKSYLDYRRLVGGRSSSAMPHADSRRRRAAARRRAGLSFRCADWRARSRLAEVLCELLPSLEVVRLVSSGTEATMSAIRLARGYTGRDLLVKFEGCYHGHSDSLLVKGGLGPPDLRRAEFRRASRQDVGAAHAWCSTTTTSPGYAAAVRRKRRADRRGDRRAGCRQHERLIVGQPEFLQAHPRELCSAHGALLIFDEVMTGFRVGLGKCAQGLYGIKPDLTRRSAR